MLLSHHGTGQKGLSPALQPNWHRMLDYCRYPTLLPASVVCSASVPARQKEESGGNLLASPPVLSGFLTATAVTMQILVLEGGRTRSPGKCWGSYMALF